jgi:hypothetical protein
VAVAAMYRRRPGEPRRGSLADGSIERWYG